MDDATTFTQETSMVKTGREKPSRHEVWRMFDRIADRYDLLNHLLSANRDKVWRKRMNRLLPPGEALHLLDLATGTGDQLLSLYDTGRVRSGVGLDLATQMLAVGESKIKKLGLGEVLQLREGDAHDIPFEENRFDLVTISFGIRNMTDVPKVLSEMHRVLRPGGRALILEFSLPPNKLVRAGYLFYLRHVLPRLGAIISGDAEAYRYLNLTVEEFPYGEQFCRLMTKAKFVEVRDNRLTLGVASIYQGEKR